MSCRQDCGIVELDANGSHTCFLIGSGEGWCWGNNNHGQLGNGLDGMSGVPTQITEMSGAVEIDLGMQFTCARVAGEGQSLGPGIHCWGSNSSGALGTGRWTSEATPTPVVGLEGLEIIDLAAGGAHVCALAISGQVYCWGNNSYGELGDDDFEDDHTPQAVIGVSNAVAIRTGEYHTCAVLTDTRVLCWGRNADGQLGRGTIGGSSPVPTAVQANASEELTGVVSLVAGNDHNCALVGLTDPVLHCWGNSYWGQLGNGSTTDQPYPVPVAALPAPASPTAVLSAVELGGSHSCVITGAGDLFCWGSSYRGQLGLGTYTPQHTPVHIPLQNAQNQPAYVSQVAAGESHTCALLADESLWCWGKNQLGQLGDNQTLHEPCLDYDCSPTPVRVVDVW